MADYYPLIARAISGLDPNAPGEARRALYERARSALIAQLRSVQPPLTESEITRERLALEEAVRKVESEAAQRARDHARSTDSHGRPRSGDAFRAGAFQGATAKDAYFVRCGLGDTMTQGDIDRGQVIVIVGFAPLKPAEFVIVRIQQKVGEQ